ncbi:MAG: alpha/beta fold hydrolase [Stackebrandtia sp.]
MSTSDNKLTFLLLHGAWCDARAWRGVARRLKRAGHDVHAPTIMGHGPDADPSATVDDAIASIVAYVEDNDLDNVVLVGHSLGGYYATHVAPRIAERLSRVVFLNAFVPSPGECIYDLVPAGAAAFFRTATSDAGWISQPFERVRDLYLATMDAKTARGVYDEMSPQHDVAFTTLADNGDFYRMLTTTGAISVSYVDFTGDIVMGPAGWYAAFADRLGPGVRVMRHEGGSHLVNYTNPKETAEALVQVGRV